MALGTLITRASLAFLTLLLSTVTAVACSCMAAVAPCQAFWGADAVFSGQVISINTETTGEEYRRYSVRVVRLLVKESFRGVDVPELEVITGTGGGDCGFGLKVGKEYLVYAYRRQDKRLETGICTRTGLLTNVDEDLTYIKGLAAAKPGSTINGEIQRHRQEADRTPARSVMPDVRAVIEGEEKTYEAVSDEKGKFSLRGIPPGTYKIRLALPVGLAAEPEEEKVKLTNKGCASVSFFVLSDGRLAGTVFDGAGQPFQKAEILLMEFGKKKYQGYANTIYSNKEGNYEIGQIPAGRYILQIRFDGLTNQARPFPLLYYPNTTDPEQALVIEFGEGQRIEKFNLYLPAVPGEYRVEGVVVRPDGQVFPDARVEYSSEGVSYEAKVDGRGQFSFKAYEGVTVSVRAALETRENRLYSDWVKVNTATKLKLVVPFN